MPFFFCAVRNGASSWIAQAEKETATAIKKAAMAAKQPLAMDSINLILKPPLTPDVLDGASRYLGFKYPLPVQMLDRQSIVLP